MAIFNFFGSILGYLLWFLYSIFRNYGIAIVLFTLILKAVMFPMSVKQQRSMASQAKLADKQKELQKRYANNQQKYNDELMKLYEKEGVNPGSGCLTTLIPFPIMLGIIHKKVRKEDSWGEASRSRPKNLKPWEKNSIFSMSP